MSTVYIRVVGSQNLRCGGVEVGLRGLRKEEERLKKEQRKARIVLQVLHVPPGLIKSFQEPCGTAPAFLQS